MYWPLFVLGQVCLSLLPVLCCRPKEYATQDGQCCPMCHEGTVVIRHCTADSGTRCGPCANGSYMNEPNGQTVCFSCTVCDQGRGLFAQQLCKLTANAVCGAKSGYFCKSFTEESGCELAQRHSGCTPGQRIKEPGTSSSDTVCESCSEGFFSRDGVICTAWSNCSEKQQIIQRGSTKEDVVCGRASRSHYTIVPPFLAFILTPALLVLWQKVRGQSKAEEKNRGEGNS